MRSKTEAFTSNSRGKRKRSKTERAFDLHLIREEEKRSVSHFRERKKAFAAEIRMTSTLHCTAPLYTQKKPCDLNDYAISGVPHSPRPYFEIDELEVEIEGASELVELVSGWQRRDIAGKSLSLSRAGKKKEKGLSEWFHHEMEFFPIEAGRMKDDGCFVVSGGGPWSICV